MIGDFFEQYVNVDWPGWILTECTNIIDDADGMKHRLPGSACPAGSTSEGRTSILATEF
jgi:hypothetical protein